jgi:Na+-transporting NADH:ubiquinone oxidoreductase subunit NqrF
MLIEAKLRELGLVLPEAPKLPPGITISFVWTRRHGNRVYLSGHALLAAVRDRLCTIITALGKEAPAFQR